MNEATIPNTYTLRFPEPLRVVLQKEFAKAPAGTSRNKFLIGKLAKSTNGHAAPKGKARR